MKKLKKAFLLSLSAMVVILQAACGSGSNGKYADYAASTESYVEAEMPYYGDDYDIGYAEEYSGDNSAKADILDDTARKLIKTYTFDVETEDFSYYLEKIQDKVNQLNGYVQNMDCYNGDSSSYRSKYAYLTLRIPVKNVDEFINIVGENANITNQNLGVEDVTLKYVDLESEKEAYLVEQERLLELLENAEDLEQILVIEERLSTIRYMVGSMESQLRTYDNLVDYATIYLNITEVKVYTVVEPEPETYGERLSRSFTESVDRVWEGLKNFLVGFVGAVPGLVVFIVVTGIILLIVLSIVKACKKKNKKKAEEAQKKAQMEYEEALKRQEAYKKAQEEKTKAAKEAEEASGAVSEEKKDE